MSRIAAYVDGFNVYHALDGRHDDLKWLDFRSLMAKFLRSKDQLVRVCYFSAHAYWNPDKVRRHKIYLRALRSVGIDVVLGEFKRKERRCHYCHRLTVHPEEKRTDVNIAVKLFEDAYRDNFDRAFIVSGDSDLIPAIETVKANFPGKDVGVICPIGRHTKQLQQVADFYMRMKLKHIVASQFPDPLVLADGSSLSRPTSWR